MIRLNEQGIRKYFSRYPKPVGKREGGKKRKKQTKQIKSPRAAASGGDGYGPMGSSPVAAPSPLHGGAKHGRSGAGGVGRGPLESC